VKSPFDAQRAASPPSDDVIKRLTIRYVDAFAEYRDIVDKNAELNLTGGRPSEQARLEEELAFEELDSARYALLSAAAQADPTIH
jgi:hypothetical protein